MTKLQMTVLSMAALLAVSTAFSAEPAIRQARLGVAVTSMSDARAHFSYGGDLSKGVFIDGVVGESPGESAGVQAGDVVVRMNGKRVDRIDDLLELVSRSLLGDSFRLIVVRDGTELVLDGIFDAWTPACRQRMREKRKAQ